MPHALPPRAFAMPLMRRPHLLRVALPALAGLLPAGLARRFGLAMVGLVSFALVSTGAVNMWVSYDEATAGAVQVQREKAQAAAERVAQFVEGIESQIGWTTRAEWSRVTPEQRRYDFIRLQRQVPAITDLQYIDGAGREQLRLSRLEPDVVGSGTDFSSDTLFTRAVAERSWHGPVYFRRGSEPYMTLSLAHVGRNPGVTSASVNLKLIWDVITAIRIGQAGYAYVTDATGRLVAHPDMSLVLRETDLSRLPQVARAIAAGDSTPSTVVGPDGRRVLSAHAVIPTLGWIVFVELPRREVLAPVWGSLVQTLVLLAFGILSALLVGGWLARRMVVPIRQLQAGAQRLGEGDLRQRISLDSQDEIGALARRFNDMAGRIQEAQETLEAKVVERTHELNERTDDLTVALERQTATAEVLQAITATPDDPQPVFDLIVRHVSRLARSATASIFVYDGERLHRRADHGYTPEVLAELRAGFPRPPAADFVPGRVVLAGEVVHVADLATEAGVNPSARGMGARSYLGIPLRHHGRVIGVLGLGRADIGAFDDTAVALAHSFAEQAVIAISGAATLHELQSRTTELEAALEQQTATAEVLRLISSTTYDLGPVFHKLVETAARLCQSDRTAVLLVENGKFRPETAVGFPDEYGRFVRRIADDVANFEGVAALPRALRERRTIHYEDIAGIPGYPRAPIELGRQRTVLALPLLRDGEAAGAMILSRESVAPFTERQIALAASFADQAAIAVENVRLLAELRERTAEAERALAELRLAQDRLVQTEKLASLGQLTAGIAHEIKNPLNFVNNFAELSAELVQELEEALAKAGEAVPDALREEVTELAEILRGNLAKVVQHGKRADSIVRNMLAHSREGGGERRQLALNPLVEEAMNLAWHGARAEKPGLNVTLEKDFDPAAGDVSLFPQEFTRVLLNLVGNAVYATGLRGQRGEPGYEPVVRVSTRALGDAVEVRVRDNGTGIPEAMRRRIFEPFFTTKPAGEGTGLGLSLSHDIVVKQHGGSFTVASEEGSFTEFRVLLPQGAREKA